MKKSLMVIFALALSLGMISYGWCQDDQMTKPVKEFYAAIQKGDIDGAMDRVAPDKAQKMEESEDLEEFGDFGGMLIMAVDVKEGVIKLEIKNLKIQVVKKDAASATLEASYTGIVKEKNEEGKWEEIKEDVADVLTMKKIDGGWFIEDLKGK